MPDHRTTDREVSSDLLSGPSTRLIRTVDSFHGDDWSVPSLLPRWSRAHVVAHLALNAEGMARGLRAVVADGSDRDALEPRTMYDSDQKRDSDIEDLAKAEPAEIRGRLLAGTTLLQEAIDSLPDDRREVRVERTPGGRSIRASAFPGMRLREIEIHHVDLGAGYTTSDWDPEFGEHLLDAMDKRVDGERPFEVRPLDSKRTWVFGSGESEYPVPVVTGPAGDLGWWLTGRPAPDTLSCSHGELPVIEGW